MGDPIGLFAVLLLIAAPVDPGGDVLRVFKARCAGCHSPAAAEVKGAFGFVLDLQRLAADREKVLPGDPANSNLFKLVDAGNMPPNGSPTGPLSDAQKTAIKTWIAAGCPAALPPPQDDAPLPDLLDATDMPPASASIFQPWARSLFQHVWRWAGELHLLLLHFPIVCLLAAAVAEWRAMLHGQVSVSSTASFCIWAAALSAIPTVGCGWIYASAGHGVGSTLTWHRWLGTSAGVLTLLTALVHSHGGIVLMPEQHATARRCFLGVAAALVVAAAHFGGKLTFGQGFLSW